MSVWALSDPHLSFGVPSKSMEVFGPLWQDYAGRIESNWRKYVSPQDLVLIPGDISWAMHLQDALVDLNWIDALPGTKVILKGNHDFWWSSPSKLAKVMPPSIHFIQNNVFNWNDITIGGARLWDSDEYAFGKFIDVQPSICVQDSEDIEQQREAARKIFNRDLERLRLSLSQLNSEARLRIALTHYPPIGADLKPSRASAILEEFKIDVCVFGHLHSVKKGALPFGEARGVRYIFASCDYLEFIPLKIR